MRGVDNSPAMSLLDDPSLDDVIYFIGAINRHTGVVDAIKIGITQYTTLHRMSKLQSCCPDTLVAIGHVRNHPRCSSSDLEEAIHNDLFWAVWDPWIRGEWFTCDDQTCALIDTVLERRNLPAMNLMQRIGSLGPTPGRNVRDAKLLIPQRTT